jgi:hypothetical protein
MILSVPPSASAVQTEAVSVSTYEAEDQKTSGEQLGPDRRFGSIPAEASGRRAVSLRNSLESVEFTLRVPARGFTIRYALPDSRDGKGQQSTAILEAHRVQVATIALTSRYSVYYGRYPFTNHPRDGRPHHFWDEERVLLPKALPAGTVLSIRPAANLPGFAVDLVDAELIVPPNRKPLKAVSVIEFGADPSGRRSSLRAFRQAIAAARRTSKIVYAPPGRYRIDGHLMVDGVRIIGAGQWYTTLAGHHVGIYSRADGSSDVSLSGFAVESDVTERRDEAPLAAIGGKFSNSSFDDLYLHHAKVGMWLDGPARDLKISNVRIADQAADGINLHGGITRAVVENNRIRNVGDDGIASWSEHRTNSDIVIRHNRIVAPNLANGIAIYGGRNIEVSNNWIADTVTEGGGIHLGARFRSAPFSGWIHVANNSLIRAGSMDPHWHFGIGAIWIYALEKPISARITLTSNYVENAGCEVLQLFGPHRIDRVSVSGLTISGKTSAVFALQSPGSMVVEKVSGGGTSSKVDVPPDFRLDYKGERSLIVRQVAEGSTPMCL